MQPSEDLPPNHYETVKSNPKLKPLPVILPGHVKEFINQDEELEELTSDQEKVNEEVKEEEEAGAKKENNEG